MDIQISTEALRLWLMIASMATILTVFAFLLWQFRESLREHFFAHKNVSLLGGLIFSGFLLLSTAVNLVRMKGESFSLLLDFIGNFSDSLFWFLLILLPFMLVFLISVSASNISLIRHEGMSLRNLLGAFLGFFVVGGSIACLFGWDLLYEYVLFPIYMNGAQWITVADRGLQFFFSLLVCYFECLLLAGCIFGERAARKSPAYDKDYLIVLGCAITPEGLPRPLLRGRLDRALTFAEAQQAAGGPEPVIVVSGGQGPDECVSEAEAMKRYLLTKGYDEAHIRMEDRSVNTYENMSFSKRLIEAEAPDARTLFVTNNYHIFRSGLFAEEVGLKAEGVGSRTKWYFWPNAFVREFIAMLAARRKHHLLVVLALLLCAFVFGLCAYYGLIAA